MVTDAPLNPFKRKRAEKVIRFERLKMSREQREFRMVREEEVFANRWFFKEYPLEKKYNGRGTLQDDDVDSDDDIVEK